MSILGLGYANRLLSANLRARRHRSPSAQSSDAVHLGVGGGFWISGDLRPSPISRPARSAGKGDLGGRGLLLCRQLARAVAAWDQRLRRYPTRAARHRRCCRGRAIALDVDLADSDEAAPWWLAQSLPPAQGACRAGLRADQRSPRLSPLPAARPRKGQRRVALVCTVHNLHKLALARGAELRPDNSVLDRDGPRTARKSGRNRTGHRFGSIRTRLHPPTKLRW